MRKKMRFLGAVLLLLFTFDAVVKTQVINPKAEIVSSSERVVKGAPFSAEAISESVQNLFDGNRITQSVKTRLYRDREGRFRRDEMPKPVGIGSFVDVPQMIFILDPVSSNKFYLYPETKTARQSALKNVKADIKQRFEKKQEIMAKAEQTMAKAEQTIGKIEQAVQKAEQDIEKLQGEYEKLAQDAKYRETEKGRLELERRKREIEARKVWLERQRQQIKRQRQSVETTKKARQSLETPGKNPIKKPTVTESGSNESSSKTGIVSRNEKPEKKPAQPETAKKETRPVPSKTAANPVQPVNPSLPAMPKGEVKNESLGTRQLEGVEAEGVRLTTTVEAGAIGNERPIEIVYERWYSKDLQLIIFSKYSDPRFGEQTYRLINIKREEPDGALFVLPADYKIVDKPDPRITIPRKKAARI